MASFSIIIENFVSTLGYIPFHMATKAITKDVHLTTNIQVIDEAPLLFVVFCNNTYEFFLVL